MAGNVLLQSACQAATAADSVKARIAGSGAVTVQETQQLVCKQSMGPTSGAATTTNSSSSSYWVPDVLAPDLSSIALVDFADAGIGDPLYDFVALFVSVFDCDIGLLRIAMQRYCTHKPAACKCSCGKQAAGSDKVTFMLQCSTACYPSYSCSPGGITACQSVRGASLCVSRRFLGYLLLHPEGFVDRLLQTHPAIRGLGSLKGVALHLFGWMDEL
jgi:hypothetical protein